MKKYIFFLFFILAGNILALTNPYQIESINFVPIDKKGAKLIIATSARPQYKYIKKEKPPALQVDFLACTFPEKLREEIELPLPPVKKVKLEQSMIKPVKIARLTLEWDIFYPVSIVTKDNALVIEVSYPEVKEEVVRPEVLPPPLILPPLPELEVPLIPEITIPEVLPPPKIPPLPEVPEIKVPPVIKPPPPEVRPPKVPPVVEKKPPVVKVKPPVKLKKEVLITLDIRDADLIDVLRLISFHACVNVIPGPDVKGAVTVKLRDVPWEEALDLILKPLGYTYTKKGKTIRVDKKEKLVPALMPDIERRVIYLAYASPGDVKARLDEVVTKDYGKVEVDNRLNAIIVTDLISNFPAIEELVAKLDASTPQVLIEAQIVKLREEVVHLLGLSWSISDKEAAAGVSFGAITSAWFRFAKVEDFGRLNLELSALIDKGEGRILARPKIIALHNKPASIIRGQEIPVLTTTFLPGAPAEPARITTSVAFRSAGTKLSVTPLIGKDTVLLKLTPEVSRVAYWKDTPAGPVPAFDTESITTEILVKDKETIVIGGIIDEEEQVTTSKVPLLGDLPFLSFFFKHRSVKKDRTELLIFLTTQILRA
jgi:hypothetical protein